MHLVHRFPQVGTYQAAVYRDEQRVGTTCFRVTEQAGATQINIDLASVGSPVGEAKCACREHPESAPAVSPDGYVLFHAPRGIGTYAVVVGEREGAAPRIRQPVADRRRSLRAGADRAGDYRLESPGGSATGELHVAPIPPGTNLRRSRPCTIDVTQDAFQPSQVNVHAGQGIVFRCARSEADRDHQDRDPAARWRGRRCRSRRAASPSPRARLAARRAAKGSVVLGGTAKPNANS